MSKNPKITSREARRRRMFTLMERYESGSLTQAEFCKRYKLAKGTFAYWLRKYRSMQADQVGFASVKILPSALPSNQVPGTLSLTYPDGSRLQFDSTVAPGYIRQLIPGLESHE